MREILLILLLQLIYVPILTLRTIFMVKKQTKVAALLGILDTLIYVFGLSLVFSGDQSVLAMIVYSVGFGAGILLGGYIEDKLAVGYTVFNVVIENKNMELIDDLRNQGFGVTIFEGEGIEKTHYQLSILTPRSRGKDVEETVKKYEPKAFLIAYEPNRFEGGYLRRRR